LLDLFELFELEELLELVEFIELFEFALAPLFFPLLELLAFWLLLLPLVLFALAVDALGLTCAEVGLDWKSTR
jgi:hypothetical protein